MKDLPNKFQMRTEGFPGFTHTVKINEWGDYEVTWARGFDRVSYNMDGSIPNKTFDADMVKRFVRNCEWHVVEDKSKQENSASSLPDEFYFTCNSDVIPTVYKARKNYGRYETTWEGMKNGYTPTYSEEFLKMQFDRGNWKIIDKKPLTAEQQKQLKDFEEQIAQLDQSIKLNEQDICHKQRLISNYNQRKEYLQERIAEIKGEESPKIVKAMQMRDEMRKLDGFQVNYKLGTGEKE